MSRTEELVEKLLSIYEEYIESYTKAEKALTPDYGFLITSSMSYEDFYNKLTNYEKYHVGDREIIKLDTIKAKFVDSVYLFQEVLDIIDPELYPNIRKKVLKEIKENSDYKYVVKGANILLKESFKEKLKIEVPVNYYIESLSAINPMNEIFKGEDIVKSIFYYKNDLNTVYLITDKGEVLETKTNLNIEKLFLSQGKPVQTELVPF